MGIFAKLVSNIFKKKDKPFVKVESIGNTISEVQILQPSNFTSVPINNSKGYMSVINTNYKVIIAFEDTADLSLKAGECAVYSTDDNGQIKAKIKLLKDGIIELEGEKIKLNGENKSFVTYAELDLGLQQLWTAIKNHTHTYTAPPSPTVLETSPSIALSTVNLDISNSETQTIKTGG
ncbi:hypothetical protein [Brachyspira alvinipulli]|uniref:hypothetical protein n=1 Tax=Brachyspira alvinipulli TaxID=84379 RepID=UPI0004815856|nr:hypothetical protein [Brachyspira alvinipulli]